MQVFVYTVNASIGFLTFIAMSLPGPAVPKIIKPQLDEIVGLIEAVCRVHLTDEYAAIARELAAALARKRPSPLMRGHSRTWACAITYTVGAVNFLFDPAQQPHVRGSDLCALFGVSQSAGAAKSREIMRVFDIVQLDPGGAFQASSRRIHSCG